VLRKHDLLYTLQGLFWTWRETLEDWKGRLMVDNLLIVPVTYSWHIVILLTSFTAFLFWTVQNYSIRMVFCTAYRVLRVWQTWTQEDRLS